MAYIVQSAQKGNNAIITPRLLAKVLNQIEKACRPEAPDAIAAARRRFPDINRSGALMPSSIRDFDWQWRPSNLQTAIDGLRKCTRTIQPTYRAYSLKNAIEFAAGSYISEGDLVAAAIFLNFKVCLTRRGEIYIGISTRDVARLKVEAEARRILDWELDTWERENLSTSEASHRSLERALRGYPDAPLAWDETTPISKGVKITVQYIGLAIWNNGSQAEDK
jgi:hypothetical protein